MARRRNSRKAKTTRRRKTGINLVNTAELYMQTAVLTNGLMGTNPLTALTGLEMGANRYMGYSGSQGQSMYGTDYLGYFPSATSITLPELLGLDKGADSRKVGSSTFTSSAVSVPFGQGIQTLKDNARANAIQMVVQSIGVRAGFAIGKKLFSKQRSFLNNKVLKPLNMRSMVVV